MTCRTILGTALLAACSLAFAQAPAPRTDAQKQERLERREKMRSAHQEAMKACEGRKGDERHKCMTQQMCAKASNPQQCEARAEERRKAHHDRCKADPAKCEAEKKERMARREKMREACKGKQGDELRACIREQRGKK